MPPEPSIDPLAIARAYFLQRGLPAFLVGGRLRDALLGRGDVDTDLAVPGDAMAHARAIAASGRGSFVALDLERDVGRVVWPAEDGRPLCLDIARFTGPGLAEDLAARDFTLNALALPLAEAGNLGGLDASRARALRARLVDPTGGLADLDARRLRMTSEAALVADPLRLLRAPRLAAELDLAIEPGTMAALQRHADLIRRPAGERLRDELLRILAADGATDQVRRLDTLGLLGPLLPEVAAMRGVSQPPPHDRDVFDHSLGVLANLEAMERHLRGRPSRASLAPERLAPWPAAWTAVLDRHAAWLAERLGTAAGGPRYQRWVWLRLAALFHDIGKPTTWMRDETGRIRFTGHDRAGMALLAPIGERLKLSRDGLAYLALVLEHHMRPLDLSYAEPLTDRLVYRFFQAAGAAGVDIAALALADNGAKSAVAEHRALALAAVADRLFGAYRFERERVVDPPPILSGHDLMAALPIAPGPELGRLMRLLHEAQAAGDIGNREEALALARRLAGERP